MTRNASANAKDIRKLALFGAVVAATIGLACSTKTVSSNKPANNAVSHVAMTPNHPAVLKTVTAVVPQPVETANPVSPKKDASKLMMFRSRDYGVSFQYPWQFAYFSAQKISADDSLRAMPDGHDGQFTLARIEIPRGYYPDTDFQSAYFTLSLNQNLSDADCTLTPAKASSLHTESINGVDFQWVESATGGRGSASRVRKYVTFANGGCYELEVGLKTSNQNGMAREVNSDQVFSRLEAILRTVKIESDLKDANAQSETAAATMAPQN